MIRQKNLSMKIFTKTLMALVATVAIASSAFAGGPMTNTNQSASFLRNPARGTSLDPDAVYFNPAGTVFMADGWHLGIGNQFAYQTRSTTSTFAPFAMGALNGGQATKEFKGSVFSPVIPSLHLTWKHNRWAVMFGMGVNGGGGTIEYDGGLASFERQFSVLPGAISQLGSSFGLSANQYSMDMMLKGSSMTLAFNLGAAYRFAEHFSVAAMVRYSTTSNGYEGHMKNIQTNPTCAALGLSGQMMPAATFFQQAGAALGALNPALAGAAAQYAAMTSDHILDVKQKGHSISPILAVAFNNGKWAASVKYEFKMATELEIESAEVSAKDPVINGIFPDGAKVENETPALLAVAASRQIGDVKISLGWNHYFDKAAKNSFTKNTMESSTVAAPVYNGQYAAIKGNTNEFLAGAEWQISDRWLVSAGAQRTQLNLNEAYYSDMNFSISSWSVALGFAFNITDAIRLNAGYMKTLYDEATSTGSYQNLPYVDVYKRTSDAFGIGLDFKFGKKN